MRDNEEQRSILDEAVKAYLIGENDGVSRTPVRMVLKMSGEAKQTCV